MNGGRHYSSPDGCLSEIGYAFLAVFIFGAIIAAVVIPYQLYFNQPTKVCVAWGDFQVIETESNGFNTEQVLKTKKICTKWEEPKR